MLRAITTVSTASADYVTYAHQVNQRLIATLPAGPYGEDEIREKLVSQL